LEKGESQIRLLARLKDVTNTNSPPPPTNKHTPPQTTEQHQIPFGWSFLSIAKVPMTWLPGDVWQAEVLLPAGARTEYKYVVLEEQDWTKLENEDAEGLVEVTYRSGAGPGRPPDAQVIQKQMAIVAWQPGPNRIVQVPTEVRRAGGRAGVAGWVVL
jgi:hypothetical protein